MMHSDASCGDGEYKGNLIVVPEWFKLYSGAMHTGKTNDLINDILKISHYKRRFPYQAFKPDIDTRYAPDIIQSLNGLSIPATALNHRTPEQMLDMLKPDTRVVGIDEIQFWADHTDQVIDVLLDKGVYVIGTILDRNFRGEWFNDLTYRILVQANDVEKNSGVCEASDDCKRPAVYTQRLRNGLPAPYDDDLVVVESRDSNYVDPKGKADYRVVCRRHFVIPGKPTSIQTLERTIGHALRAPELIYR